MTQSVSGVVIIKYVLCSCAPNHTLVQVHRTDLMMTTPETDRVFSIVEGSISSAEPFSGCNSCVIPTPGIADVAGCSAHLDWMHHPLTFLPCRQTTRHALHDYKRHSYRSESFSPVMEGFFGTGMMATHLKVEGTFLKGVVKHSGEDWSQLVYIGLQTGVWHSIWALCRLGFLSYG